MNISNKSKYILYLRFFKVAICLDGSFAHWRDLKGEILMNTKVSVVLLYNTQASGELSGGNPGPGCKNGTTCIGIS
jgi:hypothetical protein